MVGIIEVGILPGRLLLCEGRWWWWCTGARRQFVCK